jgi:hypothetical protein
MREDRMAPRLAFRFSKARTKQPAAARTIDGGRRNRPGEDSLGLLLCRGFRRLLRLSGLLRRLIARGVGLIFASHCGRHYRGDKAAAKHKREKLRTHEETLR